jgi:enoyl-CoA hydratase/carnithine racemase
MTVHVERRDHVVVITLDRPETRNALDPATDQELLDIFTAFAADRDQWVAVLAGRGDHFCAGADLKARHGTSPAADKSKTGQGGRPRVPEGGITRDFWTTKPIVAALQGAVFGGGLELALCADVRIADETARLGQFEVRWGMMPGAGGTQRLPRLVGLGVALELVMSGDAIDAQRAERVGLVNRVVPAGQALAAALDLADTIASRAPLAVRRAKEATVRGLNMPLDDGIRMESLVANLLAGTSDLAEGRRAFIEKRVPRFEAR